MTKPVSRRDVLLDAALQVIADAGLRGLTHRAVDRRAGLPEGSCSAYLRTRQALLVAAAQHVSTSLRADVERLTAKLEPHG
ncbi:MAG: TetR family transcriptional regulator, partial [Myxococcales bacterium]